MDDNTPDAKERIMNTVVGLMLEGRDMGKVTNRDIATLAGVNSALINYYYQSKENLLNQAVGLCMAQMAGHLLGGDLKNDKPLKRLKSMLRGISRFALEHRSLSEISAGGEMKSGNDNTVRTILPILKELCRDKAETELRLMALQIIIPLQVILLYPEAYKRSLGEDVSNQEKCFELLDILIDNVVTPNR
jgi:TetR/AcrR family transcriptional regulator, regulator of cefoperazone and chloramphenicol sensitivity